MKKHFVYLATDANRTYIEVGYCDNILHRFLELQQTGMTLFLGRARFSRIVHTEEFRSFEDAQKRKLELGRYTHMMKERIIRKNNPNWLSIINNVQELSIPKAVSQAV
ncbi:MAG TPA: hypothetical protein PKA53_10550 [Sphingobacterium sp.]|nr:hypothetical protein [Sphingobacterium sp.]